MKIEPSLRLVENHCNSHTEQGSFAPQSAQVLDLNGGDVYLGSEYIWGQSKNILKIL